MDRVVVYTQDGCSHCHQVKRWLGERGVAFEERHISRHPEYLEELVRRGHRAVPVVVVGGREIVGFDAGALAAALAEAPGR